MASSSSGSHGNRVVNGLGKRLLEAARKGDTDEVSRLMTNGAPLITDWLGTNPLHLASIYGHTSTAKVLIKSGINRDSRTKVDKAPLHFACQHGHLEIVRILVAGGAHVNALDMLKMTPLHWAVEANNFDICLILLKAGANPDVINKFDRTALLIAKEKGFHSIHQLLSADKVKILQNLDLLGQQPQHHHNQFAATTVKICRPEDTADKKTKTYRFPMIAGTWTGGEPIHQEQNDFLAQGSMDHLKKRIHIAQSPSNSSSRIAKPSSSLWKHQLERSGVEVACDQKTGGGNEKSPLQQLVDSVTCLGAEKKKPYVETISSSNIEKDDGETKDLSKKNDDTKATMAAFSMQNIPVISSLALNSLPPNIKAIPLGVKADSMLQQPTSENSTSKISLLVKKPNTDTPTSSPQSVAPSTSQKKQESSINIPLELLEQIMNGEVSIRSLLANANNINNNTSNVGGDSISDKLVAIDTEMGTIPIIPVKGRGGLQLIPIQPQQRDKVGVERLAPQATLVPTHKTHPTAVYHSPTHPFPLLHPSLSLIPHTPSQLTSSPSTGSSSSPSKTLPPTVGSPMLLPTGIFIQPAHPAFLQLHQHPPPQHHPQHQTRPLFSASPQLIHPQQPTVTRQYLVQQPQQAGVSQTTATFLHQPHIPNASYVFVDQEDTT